MKPCLLGTMVLNTSNTKDKAENNRKIKKESKRKEMVKHKHMLIKILSYAIKRIS